ncbi:Oxysterol-binding protein [Polychytrium aggregatum]|uniref:Oxysterol-binding protein n=1 Tax=Polychytrium aggregatum TaxID=110093 RepID=UPI0022FE85A9|nr:Oxysterol-binding protein [Polychytrium aggregatum]KAI9209194.1 Oxysterol-binding protein [Polychytrium aggregatum]
MKRRAALPAPQVSMENISLMSILRKNIGKDLSTVAMPIALNEPLNLLQKLCEELEYSELLEQAAETSDDVHRIALISAFAISAYGSTILRAGRKPFNPLLGETYECVREDKGFRFISEKVSHHPHIMACHAESRRYVFYQSNQVKTKFWGKSMELIPLGQVNVEFPALGEHYQWNKVTTCMRNILAGTRYLEHYGIMNIKSLKTGYTCQVTFKESGYFTSSKNEVTGVILDPNGQEILSIGGKWDDSIAKFHSSTPNQLEVLWRRRPNPNHSQEMYGFTDYAVQLNELHPSLEGVIPKTDSRYRTDQRMYENGLADESEMEKLRLEALQREYIKELEAQGQKWTPRFFEPGRESTASAASPTNSTDRVWRYLPGSYWEQRGRFKDEDQARDLWGQSEP